HRATHDGREFLFCSAGCKNKFEANPGQYLNPASGTGHAPPTAPAGAKWTCPMHPEIVRDGPGACPICGMALEPMMPTADSGPNPELKDMSRRFWIGLALAVPVFVLDMGSHFLGLDRLIPPAANGWLQFLLAPPVVLWAGWPFFLRGWDSLRTRNLNMFTLIALGPGVAWTYSTVALCAPGLFPPELRDHHGLVPVCFESAAIITV